MRLSEYIDRINHFFWRVAGWISLVLVLLTVEQVGARYMFHSSSLAWQELEWHLFGLIFLFAAPHTLARDGHVRIDIFYSRFSPRGKAIINLFGTLFFLFPVSVLIGWYGFEYAQSAYLINEVSPDPGGLPYRWIIKGLIPFGSSLLILQGLSEIIKSITILWKGVSR
ncbi:MAG: TRAP transporter small permease subunit [Bdellovibrionales bacterium]|nr:TRAP transporter small permease subunit [Bdellovibrionales bacterium]